MAKPHFIQKLNSIEPEHLHQLQLIQLRIYISQDSFNVEKYSESETPMPDGIIILLKWILDLYQSAKQLNKLELSPLAKKMNPDLKRKVKISKRKMESIK